MGKTLDDMLICRRERLGPGEDKCYAGWEFYEGALRIHTDTVERRTGSGQGWCGLGQDLGSRQF